MGKWKLFAAFLVSSVATMAKAEDQIPFLFCLGAVRAAGGSYGPDRAVQTSRTEADLAAQLKANFVNGKRSTGHGIGILAVTRDGREVMVLSYVARQPPNSKFLTRARVRPFHCKG